MNTTNKALWIVLGVIVVAAIVLAIIFGGKGTMSPSGTTGDTTQEPDSTQDVGDTAAGGTTSGAGAATLSYQQALTQYATRRIQLDAQCQAHPNIVTYKDNTGIMIDNRSAVARTVKIGTTYTIKPWGFRIITLPNTDRSISTYFVDCDSRQNVASIEVQE